MFQSWVKLEEPTVTMLLFDCILYFAAYLSLRPVGEYPYNLSNRRYNLSLFLITLICLFSFYDTDWFHYLQWATYSDLDNMELQLEQTSLERPYYYILYFVGESYIAFRLVIWGGAISLFLYTLKRLDINKRLALLVLLTFYLKIFSYGRVSLAMSLAFLGGSLLICHLKKDLWLKKVFLIIIGVSLMVLSLIFHKTAFFAVAVFLGSLIPLNRKLLLAAIFILPLLFSLFSSFVVNIAFSNVESIIDVDTATHYMNKIEEDSATSLRAKIAEILKYSPYFSAFFIIILSIFTGNYAKLPYKIKVFSNATLWTVVAASFFLFDFGVNTSIFFYRFLFFAIIPATITLTYLWSHNMFSKIIKFFYGFALFYIIYFLSYSIYLRLL